MRSLGCLGVLVLIVAVIIVAVSTMGMSDQERAQWVGQKAHRGWNQIKKFTQEAKQGWQQADGQKNPAGPVERP